MTRPDDELCVAGDVTLRHRGGELEVETPRGRTLGPARSLLELLAIFTVPTTVRLALARVEARSATDWAEQWASIDTLIRAGALVGAAPTATTRDTFDDPSVHVRMLADEERLEAYVAAIRTVVRPSDVVVDLGTGTGILAVAAARAGARRVYAIEESSIADVAAEVFARSGVGDRIHLLRGRSSAVELPERASVLVTETLGNDPLGEGMLVYVDDARRRLLAPGARVIPSRIEIVAQLVDIAHQRFPALDVDAIAGWRARYDVDLSPLLERHAGASTRLALDAAAFAALPACSDAVVVEVVDVAEAAPHDERELELMVTAPAERLGVAIGFRASLAPEVELVVGPGGAPTSHWKTLVEAPLVPRGARASTRVRVAFRRDRIGCSSALR